MSEEHQSPEAAPSSAAGADGGLFAAIDRQELEKLSARAAEADELRDQLLRVQADFQNFRRRMERDVDDRVRRKTEALLTTILGGIDELDRALLSSDGAPTALVDGMRMIREIFVAALAREGVKEIATVGSPFDPKLHEALTSVSTADQPPGTILKEQRKGYLWNDRVLRFSQVIVAAAPSAGTNA